MTAGFRRGAILAGSVVLSSWAAGAIALAADDPGSEGQQIATLGAAGGPACADCHGAKGQGQAASGTPRLAGISAAYIVRQLKAFAEGARTDAIMSPIAKGLPQHSMHDVAAYYATLPAPETVSQDAPTRQTTEGAVLAWRGDWAHKVPACRACHGAEGLGVGTAFPPLVGQSAAYLKAQLVAWKTGTRHDDPQGIMKSVAVRLSDDQIAAVSAFYAATPLAPPPADGRLPDGAFGEIVRKGAAIFNDTSMHAESYIGNRLTCQNCHLDAGRLANSAPMGAAFVKYPMFRKKEGRVLNFSERLQGCFRFSMNGRPPPLGEDVLVALESYAFFLAKGEPVGALVPGQGYPTLPKPALGLDFQRGRAVFVAKCKFCHGAEGAGQVAGGTLVFPALWGPGSFNWGAGMGRIDKAAGFIKANMPLSQGGTLTDQEAWDVAYFVDAHERPQDPRFTGDVAETRARFHDTPMSNYGQVVDGVLLGAHSPPSGPRQAGTP